MIHSIFRLYDIFMKMNKTNNENVLLVKDKI